MLYFWGQELELWRLACRAHGCVPASFDDRALAALVTQTALPLIVDSFPGYAARITEAARWWSPADSWWEPD